jgi:hypothetical protein
MTTDNQNAPALDPEVLRAASIKTGIDQAYLNAMDTVSRDVQDTVVTQLVGRVYEAAPLELRSQLLERLMKPLGILSLLSIAGGVFAKFRLRGNWQNLQVHLEEVKNVQASDVAALAERVQQVSTEALNGLAQVLTNSPAIASSAAAATLLALLIHRTQSQQGSGSDSWDF